MSNSKRDRLAIQLLTTPSVAEAAKLVGVSRASAYRWFKEPSFREIYELARREFMRANAAALAGRQTGAPT